jgi:hypothetical protein
LQGLPEALPPKRSRTAAVSDSGFREGQIAVAILLASFLKERLEVVAEGGVENGLLGLAAAVARSERRTATASITARYRHTG